MELRTTLFVEETVLVEAGTPLARPVRRAAGLAVIANPYAARFVPDLSPLFDTGLELGALLMKRAMELLGAPAVSYGKAAVVGTLGEMEHGGALLHPKLGKPMRAAVGVGEAIIPSNVRWRRPGRRSTSRSATRTTSGPADGGRPHPRVGQGRAAV